MRTSYNNNEKETEKVCMQFITRVKGMGIGVAAFYFSFDANLTFLTEGEVCVM